MRTRAPFSVAADAEPAVPGPLKSSRPLKRFSGDFIAAYDRILAIEAAAPDLRRREDNH